MLLTLTNRSVAHQRHAGALAAPLGKPSRLEDALDLRFGEGSPTEGVASMLELSGQQLACLVFPRTPSTG
jgi:hypothetical protein